MKKIIIPQAGQGLRVGGGGAKAQRAGAARKPGERDTDKGLPTFSPPPLLHAALAQKANVQTQGSENT